MKVIKKVFNCEHLRGEACQVNKRVNAHGAVGFDICRDCGGFTTTTTNTIYADGSCDTTTYRIFAGTYDECLRFIEEY